MFLNCYDATLFSSNNFFNSFSRIPTETSYPYINYNCTFTAFRFYNYFSSSGQYSGTEFCAIMLSNITSSTTFTHSSVFFIISFPQNLITVHPRNSSCLLTSSSRSLFLEIFFIQNSPFFPCSSCGFRISQSFP